MDKVTPRQRQFLRALGVEGPIQLTKKEASEQIEKLLAVERKSGKQFPCPYCKAKFGPRPSLREKKCPSCGRTMVHLCGKLYTAEAADEIYQKDWFKERQGDNKANIKDDWRDERKFRRIYKDYCGIGYLLRIGPDCAHAQHLNGLLVLYEDAFDKPDLLPPYDGCRHDTCECDYSHADRHDIPRRTRIVEPTDKAERAKLVTRHSAVSSQRGKNGCAGAVVVIGLILAYAAFS